jgi:hypothetical protein
MLPDKGFAFDKYNFSFERSVYGIPQSVFFEM